MTVRQIMDCIPKNQPVAIVNYMTEELIYKGEGYTNLKDEIYGLEVYTFYTVQHEDIIIICIESE